MPYGTANGDRSNGFANLRQVLDPRLATLPDAAIRLHMEAAYGPDAAEQYEDYLEGIFGDIGKAFGSAARDVGRVAAKAAPIVATVGSGALQGAMAGSALGLPGIIAGAATGGVGAGLSRYGRGTARNIGGALSGVTNIASQFSPVGKLGASLGPAISGLAGSGKGGASGAAVNALTGVLGGVTGGGATRSAASAIGGLLRGGGGAPNAALTNLFGGSSAASQLTSLIQRPEFRLALEKLKLGGGGAIPVGAAQTMVPVGAVAGLIKELADEAADEAAAQYEDAENELGYMTDDAGEFVGDPVLDRDRAAQIWNLLNNAQAERLLAALVAASQRLTPAMAPEYDEYDSEVEETAFYDAIDLAEAYALEGADEASDEWDEYDERY